MKSIVLSSVLVLAFAMSVSAETTVLGRPGGTLEEARKMAVETRARTSERITVILPDGAYRFDRVVEFDSGDSNVTYRAEHPGKVRFTGGLPLPAAQPWKGDILVADLKGAGIGNLLPPQPNGSPEEGSQIVWNDTVLRFARWPNGGFVKVAGVNKGTEKREFRYADARIDGWAAERQPRANGFFRYNWASDRIVIDKIDVATHTIRQAGKPSQYGYGPQGFWFGYNLLCELDEPGEAYVDAEEGKAYFIPPVCERRGTCEVTVGSGFVRANGVDGLVFEGILFENCRGCALSFSKCQGGGLRNCRFRNIGTRALDLVDVQDMFVDVCGIVRCGAGGISVSGGDEKVLRHSGNVIQNCRIGHYALSSLTYSAAIRVDGCGTVVRKNRIHDGPHVGIIFSGREHLFESNEVWRVCVESGEMGAFYCGRDWTLVGNVCRGNFVHDIDSKRSQHNRAFMWDDGAAGLVLVGNVISNVQEGVSLSGIGNVVESNVFIDVRQPITGWQAWTRPEDYKPSHYTHPTLLSRFRAVPCRTEPWISSYPFLAKIDEAMTSGILRDPSTRTRIEGNVFTDCPKNWIVGTKEDPITSTGWDVRKNGTACPFNEVK